MEKNIRMPLLGSTEIEREREFTPKYFEEIKNHDAKIISCSNCSEKLYYIEGSYVIKCPKCLENTAVQQLSSMPCTKCQAKMIFPANAPFVQCCCGQVYAMNIIQ